MSPHYGFFVTHIWIVPVLAVVSFVLTLFFGKRLPLKGPEFGLVLVGLAFLFSVAAMFQWTTHSTTDLERGSPAALSAVARSPGDASAGAGGTVAAPTAPAERAGGAEAPAKVRPYYEKEVTWFQVGANKIGVGVHVDGFTIMMLFVVTLISLMVHVYSVSYLDGDRRITHFFLALGLFTAGMLILVVASSGLELLLGWELMGLCSFMMIGHWWEEEANSRAALKAMLTTRTGDIGLLVGLTIIFWAAAAGNGGRPTFNIAKINQLALEGRLNHTWILFAAIALFVACIGKSAQFPLHTWLPDAMAGPTPASAIIHAATMVVAGVYMVARFYPVFFHAFRITHTGINPIAVIGGTTIVIAAALAFVQSDIKKVLAYSTVSQLGYMVMALGVGAWTGSIFHLFTHAFFKGLLFLGAGSVSHSVHSFDMKKDMGGMRRFMPVTFWTFVIGSVALAGLIPFAGFWSKDEILLGAGKNGYMFFSVVGFVGAFMTAAYMTRVIYLTFFGEFRGHGHPHESPWLITFPLSVLAVLSVFAGLINIPKVEAFSKLTTIEPIVAAGLPEHSFNVAYATLSTLVVLAAFASTYAYYWLDAPAFLHGLTERSRPARGGYVLLENRYYLDHAYEGGVVAALTGPIARASYWINQKVIDGVPNGLSFLTRRTAAYTYAKIDQGVVDGIVNGTGRTAGGMGKGLRLLASGKVQQYAALLFGAAGIGAVALAIANAR